MPLRPELFGKLKKRFGYVSVANENERMIANIINPETKPELNIIHPGEYYRVDCPFCNDKRRRLWINYKWGLYDSTLKNRNLWLCHCYNECCTDSYVRQLALFNMIFDNTYNKANDVIHSGETITLTVLKEISLPGTIFTLDKLPFDHPANLYLRSRGYNCESIGKALGVGYCVEADPQYPITLGRIIIPIMFREKLVGWQARSIGQPLYGPTYYTMPNLSKGQLLYNFDNAKKHPFVVMVEGVTDVWTFGPEAVSLLGKSITTPQRQLISQAFDHAVVVLMLDGDLPDEEVQAVYDSLPSSKKLIIKLEDKKDPGDFSREFLRETVYSAINKAGINLDMVI